MELDFGVVVRAGAIRLDEVIAVAPRGVGQLGRGDKDRVVRDVIDDLLHFGLLGLAAECRDGSQVDVVEHNVGRVEGLVCTIEGKAVNRQKPLSKGDVTERTRDALRPPELLIRDSPLLLPLVQVGPELGELDLDAEVGTEACKRIAIDRLGSMSRRTGASLVQRVTDPGPSLSGCRSRRGD